MLAKIRRHAESILTRRPRRARRRFGPDAEGLEMRNLLSSMMYPYGRFHPLAALSPASGHFRTAGMSEPSPVGGYEPSDIRQVYGFDKISFTDAQGQAIPGDGRGQTIAIVDAYDATNVVSDLHVFDQQFGLPDPPQFVKVNQTGGTTYPQPDDGWSMETALDVEWAHAMAPQANILLVESTTNEDSDMWAAVDYARRQPGVVAVSMSWGESEYDGQSEVDAYMVTPSGHGGVTFLAASGDDGGQPLTPSTSPNAVAVGGTSLFAGFGFDYSFETAWEGSGGGISEYNPQPSYQNGVVSSWSTTMRTGPDVAYNADPWYGFAVYNSSDGSGWDVVGGTSAGTPQWAALVAIADQGRALKGLGSLDGPTQTLPALYQMPGLDFNDITFGFNYQYQCTADYDLVTGLGSPHAELVVNDLLQAGTASGPFTVTGVPISTTEGQTFSGEVASVRDTYTGDTTSSLAATINWGDGTTSTGTLVTNGRGGFLVDGTHTYAVPGTYSVGITVTRNGGQTVSANGTASVADAPLEAYGFYSLYAWTGQATDQAVAWFIDGNHIAEASDFTATINWGDGTTSPGRLISQGYGMFDVAGTHTYAQAGNYTIQVTINDVGGSSASATSPMSVDDGWWFASFGSPVSATRNPSFMAAVDTSLDGDPMASPADLAANIARGDGTMSTGKTKAHGGSDGPSHFTVAAAPAPTTAGTCTIEVPINDDGGSSATAYGTANVTDTSTPAPGGGATTVSLDPLAPSCVVDEALASLGWAARPHSRRSPT
jgi:hypothetical protein